MKCKVMSIISVMFFCCMTGMASAAIIKEIPNLSSVSFYEGTSSAGGLQEFNFNINSSHLNSRRADPLGSSNNDFTGVVDREFYDVFYSDADGTFNSNGEYISIEAIYDGEGGLNISAVTLVYEDSSTEFASQVSSFLAFGSGAMPSWVGHAVDGDLYSYTQMGSSTIERLRVTVGFNDSIVPVPSAICLLGSGLIGLMRFRRKFIATD